MKKSGIICGSIFITVMNVVLFCIGVKEKDGFLNITLLGLLSLDVSLVFSFFVVQSLTSRRRGQDFIAKMLDAVVVDLGKPELLNHAEDTKAKLLQRHISNRLMYIESASPKIVKKDLGYIREKFESIQTFYGDHIDASSSDLHYEREKTNIVTKVAKVQLCLYGFSVYEEKKR